MPRVTELRVVRNGIARTRPEPPDIRKPAWLRVERTTTHAYGEMKGRLKAGGLHTVCEEAKCPNIGECWERGTITIMILGGVCTRVCQFCAVDTGNPRGQVDNGEPAHVAAAVHALNLKYVVLTSVDRDDIPDGGAAHFAAVVQAIKAGSESGEARSGIRVEALTPDFQGDRAAINTVLKSGLDVFAHNLETVRRLTPSVRDPRATYQQSLDVLRHAREQADQAGLTIKTKSSMMLGLGEGDDEIQKAMNDLRNAGVAILTLGQYLRPTRNHLTVQRYVTPEQFEAYRRIGIETGFQEVFSGPLVRSSYRAEQVFLRSAD
jgi:lipoic acid synthetase